MDAPIQTERTALVVIDMQNGFCDPEGSAAKTGFDISMCRAAIEPCQRLIEGARASEIPIIFTRLVWRADYRDGGVVTESILPGLVEANCCAAGTPDAELIPEMVPRPEDFVIDKNRYSAFYGTPLASILSSLDVRNLVLCGVTTNICVETTARDASQRDYRTVVVGDATGEIAPERHQWALETLGTRFGWVVGHQEVLKGWREDPARAS